jgi:hypothetical protein
MRRKLPAGMIACGLALSATPFAAMAQTEPMVPVPPLPVAPNVPIAPGVPLERGYTVVDRARPEVAPLGMRFGPWFFFPRAEVDESYNSNINAGSGAPGSPKDHAFITTLVPAFDLRSNFPTNALNLSAGAALSYYSKHTSFNTQDAFGAADGRLDLDATHDFHGGLRLERGHEDPGAPNVPGNIAEPIVVSTYTANAGFAQTRLKVGYSADVTAQRQEYQAVPLVGGGTALQSDRDNNSYEFALRPYYEFVPNYQAFLRGAWNFRDYDHAAIGQSGRDSHGYRVDVGARIDLTGISYGEFFVGYLRQQYVSSFFGSIGGIDAGANIVYNLTQLTSLTLKGSRTVQDTNFAVVGAAPSPGYLESSVGLSVDHELLRNVLLNATGAYVNDDFKGIDRTDKGFNAGVGAKYLLNRNLYLGANYTFERRISSGAAGIGPFSRNIFMLRVSTQL